MKIVEVREKTISIASEIKNAFIDFSAMTVSILALYTDVIREGLPVVGYGFNSNGRYSQECLLRERFTPRIINANPEKLLGSERDNLDPFAIWQVMMKNEKPGGHESYPKVFKPFGGFADHTPVIDGRVKMPEAPGVGFEAKKDLIDLFKANFD
jgi:hypothetical protein